MLDTSRLAIRLLSAVTRGWELHRAALEAVQARRWSTAELLFAAALVRYRREIEVEAIARLRVHELMARVWSATEPSRESERCLEVERRLCQLETIESPRQPFELVDARTLLGNWRHQGSAPGGRAAEVEEGDFAAAA